MPPTLSFNLAGSPSVRITVVETAEGWLRFTATVNEAATVGDLRGLFFHLADESLLGGLQVTDATSPVSALQQAANGVSDLGDGVQVVGRTLPLDVGLAFGSAAITGDDDLRSVSFTLAHTSQALSLHDVNGMAFAAVLSSVGPATGDRLGVVKPLGTAPANAAPIAGNGSVRVAEDGTLDGSVAGLVRDAQHNVLSYALVGSAPDGLVFNADGSYRYAPAPNFDGAVQFQFIANDALDSNTATVSIDVTPVNDAPVAGDDSATTAEDAVLLIPAATLLANDSDLEGAALVVRSVGNAVGGTVSLASGTITFRPAAHFNGVASFDVTVSDGGTGGTDVGRVEVLVTPVADAPVAYRSTVPTVEDMPVTGVVTGWDPDGDALTFALVRAPTKGVVTLDAATGAYTYTPNLNATGSDSFQFKANDGTADSAAQVVTLQILAVNDAPVASDGTRSVKEDAVLSSSVVGLVRDVDSRVLTYSLVGEAPAGLVFNPDGRFTYTPPAHFNGAVPFQFKASDGALESNTATAVIQVTPVNDAPVAGDDTATTAEDTVLVIPAASLLANDSDIDSPTLTVRAVGGAVGGTVSLANGLVSFRPAAHFNGVASFTYTLSDGGTGGTDLGRVEVLVTPVPDAPIANSARVSTAEDTPLQGMATGSDPDGDALSYELVRAPGKGVLVFDTATGAYTYTPNPDVWGSDSFQFRVNDGTASSLPKTVAIDIVPVDDAPSFTRGADVTLLEDAGSQSVAGWATNMLAGPPDEAGQKLSWLVVPLDMTLFSPGGAPAIDGLGNLTFSPRPDANGSTLVYVALQDGGVNRAEAMFNITLTPVNDAPGFTLGGASTVLEDAGPQTLAGWAGNVSRGPADEAWQLLAFNVSNDNAALFSAQPTIDAHGTLRYTPAAEASGSAVVSVRLHDSGGRADGGVDTSAVQTFTINVTPVNDAPVMAPSIGFTVLEDEVLSGSFASFVTDVDSSSFAFVLSGTPVGLVLQPSGDFTYAWSEPAGQFLRNATLMVSDRAGGFASALITFTYQPVNDAPSFTKGANQTVLEDAGAQSVANWATNLSTGAPEESLQTLEFIVSNSNPALFSMQPAIDANGTLSYTPAANANGSAVVSVLVRDSGGTLHGGVDTSAVQTFTIDITPVNDAPTAGPDSFSTTEDTPLVIPVATLLANDSDVDGDAFFFFGISGLPSHVTFTMAGGNLTFTPAAHFNGVDRFDYTILSVGQSLQANGIVTIAFTPVNDAPSFTKGADQTVLEDAGAQSVAGWATNLGTGPADESGQTLGFLVDNDNPALFSVQPGIDANGTLLYTPATNANGRAVVSVRVQDNGGTADGGVDTSGVQTFTIDVTPVNDAPVSTEGSITMAEDTTVVLTLAHFGNYSDVDGTPLAAVRISNLENTGDLECFDGSGWVDVSLNQVISAADIAAGHLRYRPALNDTGRALIGFNVSDGVAFSKVYKLNIDVTPVNDAPVSTDGAVTMAEDTTRVFTLADFGSYSDVEGTPLAGVRISKLPNMGSLEFFDGSNWVDVSLNQVISAADILAGRLRFTPGLNDTGRTAFSYNVSDGAAISSPYKMSIDVTPVNDAPTAVDDLLSTAEDTPRVISTATLLANDGDVDGDAVVFHSVGGSAIGGTVSVVGGNITFTPAANFNGVASFEYQIVDAAGAMDTGLVTVQVTPINDSPTFSRSYGNDVYEGDTARQVVSVIRAYSPGPANEADQELTFSVVGVAASVSAPDLFSELPTISSSGVLTYTLADTDFNGSISVYIKLADDGGVDNLPRSFVAPIDWNVWPVNDAPSFTKGGDQVVLEDAGAQSVLGWATNISAGPANEADQTNSFIVSNDNPALFSVPPSIDAHGTLTYTPAANANGSAVVSVQVHDDGGTTYRGVDTSGVQTFTIQVTPVNDSPTFSRSYGNDVYEGDTARQVVSVIRAYSPGPANEADQVLSFSVVGVAASVAAPDLFSELPTISSSGVLTYTLADTDFNGSISVYIKLADDGGVDNLPRSFVAPIDWNVWPVNDAPSFTKGGDQVVLEDAGAQSVLGWATNISTGPANEVDQTKGFIVSNDNPALFSVPPSIDASGTLTYTPAANANGSAVVSVQVKDNGGTDRGGVDTSGVQTFTIQVTPVNDAPVSTDGAVTMAEDTTRAFTLTDFGTYSDIEGTPLAGVRVSKLPNMGSLEFFNGSNWVDVSLNQVISAADILAGRLRFTPGLNDTGRTAFSYNVSDGAAISSPYKMSIDVTPVNDAPVSTDGAVTMAEDTTRAFTLTDFGTYSDVEGTPLAGVRVSKLPNMGSLEFFNGSNWVDVSLNQVISAADILAGRLRFTPGLNDTGRTAFSFNVSDGAAISSPYKMSIDVTPVNDAPVAVMDTFHTVSNELLVINTATLLANDFDVDGDVLTFSSVRHVTNGSVTFDLLGRYIYFHPGISSGLASFSYLVLDGSGGVAEGRVEINIEPRPAGMMSGAPNVDDRGASTADGAVAGETSGQPGYAPQADRAASRASLQDDLGLMRWFGQAAEGDAWGTGSDASDHEVGLGALELVAVPDAGAMAGGWIVL